MDAIWNEHLAGVPLNDIQWFTHFGPFSHNSLGDWSIDHEDFILHEFEVDSKQQRFVEVGDQTLSKAELVGLLTETSQEEHTMTTEKAKQENCNGLTDEQHEQLVAGLLEIAMNPDHPARQATKDRIARTGGWGSKDGKLYYVPPKK